MEDTEATVDVLGFEECTGPSARHLTGPGTVGGRVEEGR